MHSPIFADIAELRSKAGLARLTCRCHVLLADYVPRRAFSHRYHETHEVAAVTHTTCSSGHRCGQTQPDGQHRGLCGPAGPEKPAQPIQAPTPDSPPAVRPQPVRKPARPAPRPVPQPAPMQDDAAAWDSLLASPQPVSARR